MEPEKGWWEEEDSPEIESTAWIRASQRARSAEVRAQRKLEKIQLTPEWEPLDFSEGFGGRVLKTIATIVVILVVMEIML